MAPDPSDRELTTAQIDRMVTSIRPDWRVREASLENSGHNSIYHLVIDTTAGVRECVLKAATPAHPRPADVATEARYVAILRDNTTIPVPDVFGVVDDHDGVPAPFFLMERRSGTSVADDEVGTLSDAVLRRIAHDIGMYFAQLHGLDIDTRGRFGDCVDYDGSPSLRGERPSGNPSQLTFRGGYRSWHAQLRDWIDAHLDQLAETQFSDLTPAVRSTLNDRLDALPSSFSPVLSRMDQTPANLLVDPESGTIQAMLDWETPRSLPPTYDLAITEYYLAGGPWMALPNTPDRRTLVRDALLAGYRREATVPKGLTAHRDCVQLDTLVMWSTRLDHGDWSVPSGQREAAAAGLRTAIEEYLE